MEEQHLQTLLFHYFSGQAAPEEEKEIWEWLEADEQNKKIFAEMSDWWATVHVLLFISDRKADFIKHFGTVSSAGSFRKKQFHLNRLVKIAASVLILFGIGSLGYEAGKNAFPEQEKIVYLETAVPLGANSRMILPDESNVWINAGSTLIYKEDPASGLREVELKGEAYFEVAPDPARPFVIKTGGMEVKVLGTSFNVKAYEEEETVDVVLVSGKVHVRVPRKEEQAEMEMIPSTLLSYHKTTADVSVERVVASDFYLWKEGVIRFHNKTFQQLIPQLERKFNVKIDLQSSRLAQEVFSGSFTADYTLQDILEEVDIEKKYTWSRQDSGMIIRDKSPK